MLKELKAKSGTLKSKNFKKIDPAKMGISVQNKNNSQPEAEIIQRNIITPSKGQSISSISKFTFKKVIKKDDGLVDTLNTNENTSISNSSFKAKNKSFSSYSRNRTKSIVKQEFSRVHTDYNSNLRTLEKIITGIKNDGFDKIKCKIEEQGFVKMELEARVSKLQGMLSFTNSQKRKFGTKNLIIEQSTIKAHCNKEVCLISKYRELNKRRTKCRGIKTCSSKNMNK